MGVKRGELLGPTTPNQNPSDISGEFEDVPPAYSKGTMGENGVDEDREVAKPTERRFPPPILEDVDDECMTKLRRWLDERLEQMRNAHDIKSEEWSYLERAYEAKPQAKKTRPFVGACNDVIPVIGMAVDPIQSRLDIGVMKQSPVFSVNPIRKSLVEYKECLEDWIEFNQRHRWKLRQVASARFFELAKFGTMVFKTVYDRVEAPIKTWDYDKERGSFKQVKKRLVKFTGARVIGIPLDRFYFPPGYSNLDDCPIAGERLTPTYDQLRVAEASGKITNVNKLGHLAQRVNESDLEQEQGESANHHEPVEYKHQYELYELWFSYDIDDDGYPEDLVAIYEPERKVFLQLTYNWYFHQRKPYTVVPYTIRDGTMYGIGLAEMCLPFQEAITKWHQMAQDNAYLANIRMYVAKKNSGIEEVPRLYAGRVFFVDDPSKDFKPFATADIYPSTMVERQNLFGMVEKRTGVSDYLTGRESPILGSRATATSTIALIQEGTKRVEETLENIRAGFGDVIEKGFCIWIQYGTEDLEDIVFKQDATAGKIRDFFRQMSAENVVNGAIGVTLKATDAGENKQARQQMALAIISAMMSYFNQLLQAGQSALLAMAQGMPQYAEMVAETMNAAKQMFTDLLKTYDIRNPEQYIPDLARFLTSQGVAPEGAYGQTNSPPANGSVGGDDGLRGVEALLQEVGGAGYSRPEGAPSSGRPPFLSSLTG